MICIETKYFFLHRVLLLALGLWPYHQSNFVPFQIILCLSILASFIIFQLTIFLTEECTSYLIIKIFSIMTYSSLYIIHYNAFWLNAHNVKHLMERLQEICNELKDENEINIVKEYGNNMKRHTVVIISFTMSCFLIFILTQILMPIALHVNGSQPHQTLYFMSEYFNQIIFAQENFYIILLHLSIIIFIGATTMIATATLVRGCLVHTCALFKIASYRIEQAMTIKMLENTKNESMTYKEIISAVDIQRKAIKYSQFVVSRFRGFFSLTISIHVISLSLNLFIIFQSVSTGNKDYIIHGLLVLVILLYMFLVNYTGQEIMDHSNYIYVTAYNVRWYVTPVYTQKLILFILRRRSKIVVLNVGYMFVISLEFFATLLKASVSYFTFMYSTQQ